MLVTGSSGYVGRRLVARLAERGTPVRALVHRSRADLPEGVEAVEGDVTDTASLARACEGADVVVNLASITADRKPPAGRLRPRQRRGRRRRSQPRRRTAGVRRFVHLAGIDTTIGEPGPYLAGRRRGDAAVLASGIESVAILRPSIMFGGARLGVRQGAGAPRQARAGRARAGRRQRAPPAGLGRGRRALHRAARRRHAARGSSRSAAPTSRPTTRCSTLIGEGLGKRRVRKLHLPGAGLRRRRRACCRCCPARRSRRPRSSCSRATTSRPPTRSSSSSTSARAASRSTCAARASTPERPARDEDLLEVLARAAARAPIDVAQRA